MSFPLLGLADTEAVPRFECIQSIQFADCTCICKARILSSNYPVDEAHTSPTISRLNRVAATRPALLSYGCQLIYKMGMILETVLQNLKAKVIVWRAENGPSFDLERSMSPRNAVVFHHQAQVCRCESRCGQSTSKSAVALITNSSPLTSKLHVQLFRWKCQTKCPRGGRG